MFEAEHVYRPIENLSKFSSLYFISYVTHESKHFIYFYMGQVAILLFKSG